MDSSHLEACQHARNLFEALIFLRDEVAEGNIKGSGGTTRHRNELKKLFPILQPKADMKAAEKSVKDREWRLSEPTTKCLTPSNWKECQVPFLLCRQCSIPESNACHRFFFSLFGQLAAPAQLAGTTSLRANKER